MDGPRLTLLYVTPGQAAHDRRFLAAFAEAGIHAVSFTADPASGDAAMVAGLREVVESVQPSVTLAGTVHTGAWAAVQAGAPRVVAMSWGSDLLVDVARDADLESRARIALDGAVALFADTQAVVAAAAVISPEVVRRKVVLPWGVDVRRFSPGSGKARPAGWEGAEVFISTRSWEPLYAVDSLVLAFSEVVRRHPKARLLLGGGGSQEALIRGLIADLGLHSYIEVIGRFPNESLPDYLRMADVYVSSATSDGASVSLLEAMACGLPAVVVGAYGNLDWVEAGRNGWLARPRDPESLAEAMSQAIVERPRRGAMSEANVALVRARADWSANAPKLVAFLQGIAASPPGRP